MPYNIVAQDCIEHSSIILVYIAHRELKQCQLLLIFSQQLEAEVVLRCR